MDVIYWFSLSHAHYACNDQRKTVDVYKKIDGTEFHSTHISTIGSKPRMYDIVLVARGDAEYVRSVRPPPFTYHRDRRPIFTMADRVSHCAICLEDTGIDAGACQLRCKHHFHQSCIGEWYLQNDTCPCCRADVERVDADLDVEKDVELKLGDLQVDMKRIEEETKRMRIKAKTKQMEEVLEAKRTEMEAKRMEMEAKLMEMEAKRMRMEAETMLLQMLQDKKITFDECLQMIKNLK